jgi:hypothetical protein
MIAELRIYKLKPGMAEDYMKIFNGQLEPNHTASGINILGAWFHKETNTVYWIRTFEDQADMDAQLEAYHNSDVRKNLDPLGGYAIADHQILVMDDIMNGNTVRDDSLLKGEFADAAWAAFNSRQFERRRSGAGAPVHS